MSLVAGAFLAWPGAQASVGYEATTVNARATQLGRGWAGPILRAIRGRLGDWAIGVGLFVYLLHIAPSDSVFHFDFLNPDLLCADISRNP